MIGAERLSHPDGCVNGNAVERSQVSETNFDRFRCRGTSCPEDPARRRLVRAATLSPKWAAFTHMPINHPFLPLLPALVLERFGRPHEHGPMLDRAAVRVKPHLSLCYVAGL